MRANRGINGQVNERGIETWSVKWWAETVEEARACGESTFLGFPLKGRVVNPATGEGPESLGYFATLTYEGLAQDTGVPTYQFSPSTGKEPMERHPDIVSLMKTYGGVEQKGRIIFPAVQPPQAADDPSGFALPDSASSSGDTKNPLFGWEDYPVWGGTWSQTIAYLEGSLPSDPFDDVWLIVESVPGPMRTPRGRNWMVIPPGLAVRGNGVDLTRNWMIGPPGGWPPIISEILRTETRASGGANAGLILGSLQGASGL